MNKYEQSMGVQELFTKLNEKGDFGTLSLSQFKVIVDMNKRISDVERENKDLKGKLIKAVQFIDELEGKLLRRGIKL